MFSAGGVGALVVAPAEFAGRAVANSTLRQAEDRATGSGAGKRILACTGVPLLLFIGRRGTLIS